MSKMEFRVKGKLENKSDFYPWARVELHDFQKSIESIDLNIEKLEKIEVRFTTANLSWDYENPIVEIDERDNKKVAVHFWNDAAEKLLAAFKTIVEELEWEDVEEEVKA